MGTIDLFRYHDLTERLAAFRADGGAFLRGDPETLAVEDGEPAYAGGEVERARIAGIIELYGPRSVDGDPEPSLGLVGAGQAMLALTSERLIVLFRAGRTRLGPVDEDEEVHAFVLPWDLVDSISMAKKKSIKDRLAGARTILVVSAMTGIGLSVFPAVRQASGGETESLTDDDALALLTSAAAAHRLSVSPPSEHPRLRALLDGRYEISGDDLIANVADESTQGIPAHLEGRLVERTTM